MNFRPGWPLSLFFLFFFPLTLSLGVWQVNRAQWKTQLVAEYENKMSAPAEAVTEDSQALDHIWIQGVVDKNRIKYWDNRTLNGQVGYELLVPVALDQNHHDIDFALVNMGWLPAPERRSELPALPAVPAQINWQGVLRKITLQEPESSDAQQVVQAADVAVFAQANETWLPFLIQLDPLQPYGLMENWQPTTMPPAKHRGYAVQWFGLAATLVILFLVAGYRRGNTR